MATRPHRRDFLKGKVHRAPDVYMRPPGSIGDDFTKKCTGCSACLEVCPEGIIGRDAQGKAFIDLWSGECTFCGKCAEACEHGALVPSRIAAWPWRAEIAPTCLSLSGIACRSCQDVCDAGAIRFRPETGGRATPNLDLGACTGCGACAAACPVSAVTFTTTQTSHPEAME